jgi:pimeloyl-ACP methyl ester carboxylesterase
MPATNPIILLHGYSDQGLSFEPWKRQLVAAGHAEADVHICEYKSLTNEVTIKDLAEGFDRALRTRLKPDQAFDAIVHSTGMLVIRSWLATYGGRRTRLKRLVALAPATNGSPLAHRGRGYLGAIFKGNRIPGTDFMEAGDQILDGLELGSRFTWDLAHQDLLGDAPFYRRGKDSPYVFILCGTARYSGLKALVNEEGSDGTVRLAGCSLDSQKLCIDLARDAEARAADDPKRIAASDTAARTALPMRLYPVAGKNHSSILEKPDGALRDLVLSALAVTDDAGFDAWRATAEDTTREARDGIDQYQQFVVRAVDERGDPITDYFIELFSRDQAADRRVPFDLDVHAYRADPSLRCFHINLTKLFARFPAGQVPDLWVRIIASSGSDLVGYHGLNSERMTQDATAMEERGVWDAEVKLPAVFGRAGTKLFWPFTTTFLEVRLNRDPLPFGQVANKVCYFV